MVFAWRAKSQPTIVSRAPTRFVITLLVGMSLFDQDSRLSLALSPDGQHLVFAASVAGAPQLYVRNMGEFQTAALRGTEGGECPLGARSQVDLRDRQRGAVS